MISTFSLQIYCQLGMGNVKNFPVAIITKGNTVTMINMVIAVEDEKTNYLWKL